MIDKIDRKFLIIFIIIEYFISLCSSQCSSATVSIDQYSTWNISLRTIIFGQTNMTAGNDDNSLSLSNSALDINRNTDAIAVLDDKNGRIIVFNQSTNSTLFDQSANSALLNQSNSSTLFIIALDSSNLTNISTAYNRTSIMAYGGNGSMYIVDGLSNEIMKINNPLDFGENVTSVYNFSTYSNYLFSNLTARGLCVDNTEENIFVSDYDHHQIIRYEKSTSNVTVYIGNGTAGSASNQLYNPTSIVIDNSGRLFVNDFGNKRIQMFTYNSTNGTTLNTNISDCIGLSLYSQSQDILVMNTNTSVHLFNLTNNATTCAIGCNNSTLNDIHNAAIDNCGNLIVTGSNVVFQYQIYQQIPDVTTQSTSTTTSVTQYGFVPINNCGGGNFGINCSSSENICNMSQPCSNSGTCFPNNTFEWGYNCNCPPGYNGTNCENDQQPCKPLTCFYPRGNCSNSNTSTTGFECQCERGYEGLQCEIQVNFCANATCENKGVCFQEYLNYTCQCLWGFYGRNCEMTETSALVHTYAAKSFSYIAILMIVGLFGFIFAMDVLKYVFHIDPVRSERNKLRKKYTENLWKKKKAKQPKVIQHFQYVS